MSTGINVTKPIKILDEGVLLTPDVSQIDFTGGVTATTSGNNVTVNVPAAGITVGTTPVTSGTNGRVFFQAGGVVQQDGAFNWDNTNKRLGIGANATSPTAALFLRTNTLVANDIFTIQNGQYGNNILRVRDNVTASQSTIGSIFVQARIYGSGSTITGNEFDLGGYGLGASYGDNGSNAVWLNNQGNVGDGTGSSVIAVSSNLYVNLQTTKKYKFETFTGNFGIGNVGTLGARLDVRAQGALSTDIAFRVRNSADTQNLLQVSGDGYLAMGGSPITMGLAPTHTFRGLTSTNNRGLFCVTNAANTIRLGVGTSGVGLGVAPVDDVALTSDFAVTDAFQFKISGNIKFSHTKYYSNYDLFSFNRAISFSSSSTDATVNIAATTNKAHLKFDVAAAPSGTHLDNGVMWHESNNFGFRVNGQTIKLYQETTAVAASTLVANAGTNITDTDTFDGYTLKQIVKALRNQGLLA
jgi:hypothetical protein